MSELAPATERLVDAAAAAKAARRDAFRAQEAEWRRQRAAAKARIAAGLRIGSEWTSDAVQYSGIIVGDASRPGKVILRLFDSRGFNGGSSRDSLQDLVAELLEDFGCGVREAPGALERLAPGFMPLVDFVIATREKGPTRFPWIWHEERFFGDHQRADYAASVLSDSGLLRQVLVVSIDSPLRADRVAAARRAIAELNAPPEPCRCGG